MCSAADTKRLQADALGQEAFEAYRSAVNDLTHDGKPIPGWANMGERQRIGWRAAAQRVIAAAQEEDHT